MSGEELPAWTRGDLRIGRAALEAMEADALACYPNESCGFVTGPAADPLLADRAIRAVNEADKYHALDPVRFPRTARMYFKINELAASRIFEAAERDGAPVKIIYHSHTDVGAYFSAEDAATFSSGGVLTWPCAFVVVSVVQGKVADRRLWVHVPGTDGFRESTFTVV